MSDELVFYTNPMSRGRIVRWMLEEVGQPYRTEVIEYGPQMKGPDYLAINPMGKVPALRHGSTVVTEVSAICAYLADAFPQAQLAPAPQDHARGAYYRWFFFAAGPVEAAVTNKALGVVVPDGRERMVGYGTFELAMATLEKAIEPGPYILGKTFSAADVYSVPDRLRPDVRTMEKRPSFEAYWSRLSERPAYKRATELDAALAPPKT